MIPKQLRQLKKDSVIYGIGNAFTKCLSVLLLPVYTRLFPPVEYGLIEMLTMTNAFLALVLNMGLDAALSYYFYKDQQDQGAQKQVALVSAIIQWHLSAGLLITILATCLSPIFNYWMFDGRLHWKVFAVVFSGSLFFQICGQSAQIFQLLFCPWRCIGIIFLQSLSSAAIAIGLIVWLDMGFLGYFLGFSAGSLVAALVGWWMARQYIDWSELYVSLWPKILSFGLPLIPANFAFYFMETSDRWILGLYHGGVVLGVYAVGAKVAMAVNLVVEPFRRAWGPIAYKSMHEAEGHGLFPFMARAYIGVGAAGIVLLTAYSPTLVRWVATPNYYDAYQVIGLLGWK